MLGDTYEADVVGANTAGWHTIWFNHRNRECPEKNRADITVKSIEELKEVIRQKDPEFVHELNKARIGDYSCVSYFNTHSQKRTF